MIRLSARIVTICSSRVRMTLPCMRGAQRSFLGGGRGSGIETIGQTRDVSALCASVQRKAPQIALRSTLKCRCHSVAAQGDALAVDKRLADDRFVDHFQPQQLSVGERDVAV